MSRRQRSLHFNLKEGQNVVFHRDHRSKKGRSRFFHEGTESYYHFKKRKEALKWGVDDKSLRYIRKRYSIY